MRHRGADGIEFDVAHAGNEVAFCLDDAELVGPFRQATGSSMGVVDVLRVVPTNGLHHFGDCRTGFWRDQQVDTRFFTFRAGTSPSLTRHCRSHGCKADAPNLLNDVLTCDPPLDQFVTHEGEHAIAQK